MVGKGRPGPGQEELIVGDTARDFEAPLLSNNRLEQKHHLLKALADLAAAKMRDGFLRLDEQVVLDRYGENAEQVAEGADRLKGEYHASAEEHFKKAFRLHEMEQAKKAGAWVVDKLHAHPYGIMRGEYSRFLKLYYLKDSFKARADYRERLLGDIAEMKDWPNAEQAISPYNQTNHLRPHDPDRQLVGIEGEPLKGKRFEQLDRRLRLEAFLYDPRAEFVPKHTGQLNRMLSWLDYMDTSPDGINAQLEEVYTRGCYPTRKSDEKGPYLGSDFGIRAVESVVWETGDYLLENEARLKAVSTMRDTVMEEGRPDMSLYELLHDEHPGLSDKEFLKAELGGNWFAAAAFVQYLDIMEYIQTGEVKGLSRHPLRETENPPDSVRAKFDARPGKRKTVYNQYTGVGVADETGEYATHIIVKLKTLTVGEARQKLPGCLSDLQNENAFTRRRMNELARFRQGQAQPVRNAVYAVGDQLQTIASATQNLQI